MAKDRRAELQAELLSVLQVENADISQVLALATELAKNDPDNVRFFTDAGLIRRLGYELVSRQETAVSELVKNAYDADATTVNLIFVDSDKPGGTLVISDNGIGMRREDLVKGFMRLSSTLKVSEPVSPRYKRRRAGRKGIGRFAVQRLGTHLTIKTQVKDVDHALVVSIDWDRFEEGQDLTSISSRVEEEEKKQDEGTTLTIGGLRDKWTLAQMRRIWRYVSDLLQPFPLSEDHTWSRVDPGFSPTIYRPGGGGFQVVADEETEIYRFAVAEIDASVDSSGRGQWAIKSRLFPEVNNELIPIGTDPEDPSISFELLRDVRLKAYYFIYQSKLMPPKTDSTIRRIADTRGGIRLYRNGFRVLPYGEKRDDWLTLDIASARRQILPPISNVNFFGFVEVTDPEGTRFEETASREGLIENTAFQELTSFVFRVLRASVFRIAGIRRMKKIAAGRGSQIETPPEEMVRKAIEALREASQRPLPPEIIDNLGQSLEELEQKQADLIDEIGMLRVLASLGIVIGEFTHEIRSTLTSAALHTQQLRNEVREMDSTPEAVGKLEKDVDRINAYARYFDRAVRENVRRELQPHELGAAVLAFKDAMWSPADRRNVSMDTEVDGFDLFTCPMHGSELESILFNFYTNSLKAIRRAKPKRGKILIRCGEVGDKVYLEFLDNGDGVPEELRPRIFDPFFTTSTQGGDDPDDDLRGSGLGLKIVSDIALGYGGDVDLPDPPTDYVTSFRVVLPAASEEELDEFNL